MITIYNTIVINYNHIYNFLPPHFTTIYYLSIATGRQNVPLVEG